MGTTLRDGSHDFDFQTGRWRIKNVRLVKRLQGCTEWETFEATQSARPLPSGVGNVDDFRTDYWPDFVGMSLRLYDRKTRQWSIYWASTHTVGFESPVVGRFDDNGEGIFEGRQELDGKPIVVRFTWSNITETSARWEQEFSPDDGKTWEKNWIMEMTRIPDASEGRRWRPPRGRHDMELCTFARFHARPGNETAVRDAILEAIVPAREETGCVSINAFRSVRDPQLFYIHSRWKDEAAFELHATLPHTVLFLERVEPLIDHPLDVNRTEQIG